ncbi:MAG TPA: hypothetical protein VKB09_05080, partial [Thermomicrobiales bacterium]|nr:hypothetical protein [Thermomicrobiales bacterium]
MGWGARLEMTLSNLAFALASARMTLVDVPDFFYRDEVRQRVLEQVANGTSPISGATSTTP